MRAAVSVSGFCVLVMFPFPTHMTPHAHAHADTPHTYDNALLAIGGGTCKGGVFMLHPPTTMHYTTAVQVYVYIKLKLHINIIHYQIETAASDFRLQAAYCSIDPAFIQSAKIK
jgi:hypothetical protein